MKKICIASLRCLAVLLTVIMVMAATILPAKAYITYSCGHNSGQHSDPLHVRLIGYEIEEQTSSGHYKRPIFATLCPVCGAEIGTERGIGTDYEKHSFDTNGCCKVCGYVTSTNECDHNFNHWGSEFLGWGTPDKENHYRKFELWYRCYWCNELAYTEEVIEPERHKFDANGRCTVCGYTSSSSGSCKHTNKKSEKVGSVSKQYDDKYHETIVTYRDVCADCNAVLSAERKDTNKFDHRFDANGTCFCGYVQAKRSCDHTPTETLKDTKYGKADINGHEVIKTYHYECECKQVSYDEKKTSVGAHDYNRNTCRLCGFEKECEHPDFENVVSTAVEKNPNSASMHIIVTTYAEKCFCGAANPNPVKRTAEACRFIKNTDVQAVHEKQGHQYVDKCECGNEKANGKFKAYVSGCADCKHFYDQCVLSRGNASNIPEKVKELQELLMRSGYDLPYYGADGDFSRETEKAVEKFQKDHGLPVTGVVDEATWNALKNTLNYTDTLSKGNPSNKTHVVKELQELLIKNGYELPYYGADGDFSRETEKAVKKFQKDHGLPETGVVDEATWAMLRNPDGTFETDAPGHGPMEGLTDDNPSHSSAETLLPKADSDDDTEGTPSHAPMEGIDEGEPDHGTMEGIEDDSPSHSLDATLPPKIEDESEVVIDGSFGKASYTAEIGDTLSISVRAGSENANLERVTINVDGSGVDRLASEAISGTAWSGTLPLNCSAYPLNTPGTYTLKLYVSADAGDPNWAIVDYATLVVNDAPVKPDKPVVNVAIDGNTMTATWNAVDGADRYVYSLYNITDDYRIVQHASANKLAASASLEAGKQYRIAVAAVPAGVVDTETEADKCSWDEVVFTVGTIEETERPVVLSVTPDMTGKILLPGEKVTFTITCNSTTVRLDVYDADYRTLYNPHIDSANCVCFTYEAAYSANGKYQLRFVALDAQGQWSDNTADYGYANIVVCDHTTVRSDVPESTIVEKKENDGSHHYVVKTYHEQCACGEINKPIVDRETVKCSWTVNAGVQSRHDTKGHQQFNRCNEKNCGNAYTNGSFVSYLASCSTCQEMYGKDALAQGNRNNDEDRVKELQELLEQNGYDLPKYGADGDFGGETASAVERFQRDHGLPVTGVVDDATWVALKNGVTIVVLPEEVIQEETNDTEDEEEKQYKLQLKGAKYAVSAGSAYQLISKGQTVTVDIIDVSTNKPIDINEINRANLYIAGFGFYTENIVNCTFNRVGEFQLDLVRYRDGKLFDTLNVYVTTIAVEDSMISYEDDITEIVQMQDMENVDWKYDSVMVTKDVAINDFQYNGNNVSFEAYNSGVMVYAVVSYDADGKEIDRYYIDTYDYESGLAENMSGSLWATGRTFDTKANNEDYTKQTNVNIKTEKGGYIRILQANEDESLFAVNVVEYVIRTMDVIGSTTDVISPVDMGDVTKVLEEIGKKQLIKLAEDVIKDVVKSQGTNASTMDVYNGILTDPVILDRFVNDFLEKINQYAESIGKSLGKQKINFVEDCLLDVLGLHYVNVSLDVMQSISDAKEFNELANELSECLNGQMNVRIRSIEIE